MGILRTIHTGFLAILASYGLLFAPAFADGTTTLKPGSGHLPPLAVLKDDGAPQRNPLTALHFWATWCVPCVKELPEVDAAAAKYADKGFRVVAISLDGNNEAKARQFLADHAITHVKLYLDTDNATFKAAEIKGLPSTVFVDSAGKEIARSEGPIDWQSSEITSFMESHLK